MIGLMIAVLMEVAILYNVKKPSKMLFLEFYLCLFSFSLITNLKAPSFIYYFMDLNNIIILMLILLKIKEKKTITKYGFYILILVILFLGLGLIISLANKNNIALIIWSFRSYTRFMILFMGVVYFWKEEYSTKVLKSFFPILIVNTVVSLYQYRFSNYSTDCIGGIFGNNYGVNGYSIFFFMIAMLYYIDSYINNTEKLYKLIISMICIFASVIIADLKVFYFIFIIELIAIMKLNKIRIKNILLLLIIISMSGIIYNVCLSVYNSTNIFNLKYINKYLTESSYSYSESSINRTDGIKIINRLLNFSDFQKFFGCGLGAGEYNAYFQSPIYTEYSQTHYYWFLYAWLYLETGYVGLFIYSMILVTMLFQLYVCSRKKKKIPLNTKIGISILPALLLMTIYSSALKTDSAYIIFFFLGIAYKNILNRGGIDNEFIL